LASRATWRVAWRNQGRSNLTSQELMPGLGWQLFSSPYATVSFLYPPDWTAQLLYAQSFTRNAAPIWTSNMPQAGGCFRRG
jgi:hypothetical protein